MRAVRAFCIAFSMYSRLPVPSKFEWKEEDMKYAISFFPLTGIVIGAIFYFWYILSAVLPGRSELADTLIAAVIPVLVTGGIHLDGFMDTSDALSSWKGKGERLQILSDSHIGAFAVIRTLLLAAVYLAALLTLNGRYAEILALGFVYARALSGISVVTFQNAKKEGTLYSFASASRLDRNVNLALLMFEAGASAVLMILLNPRAGIAAAAAGLLTWLYYRWRSYRDFGGITGDVAGWFLCNAEVIMACALAVCFRLGILG